MLIQPFAQEKGGTMSRRESNHVDMFTAEPQPAADAPAAGDTSRREFLKAAGAMSAALLAARRTEATASGERAQLPQVPFGKFQFSRLICGSNCFYAGSHLSSFVNHEMRQYYTDEQILKTLRRCQEVGINCWQISGRGNLDLYRRLCDEVGPMHAISLGRDPAELPAIAKAGVIGVAHHGEVTDNLFKSGKLDEVHDFLKRVRDAGMMAGVSTHMPAVVDAVESKGWDLDYYMTCVYERHRSEEELKKLLGYVPLPAREVYLKEDPPRMFQAIQKTKRPCLAFKILAAGRLCDHKSMVEQAFRETLQGIKPGDGVIVGIYDKFSNQPAEDAGFVRRYGAVKLAGG
jgi:hypothetical protein